MQINLKIKVLLVLESILMIILVLLLINSTKRDEIIEDNKDFFQVVDILLSSNELYEQNVLDSTKLISIDLRPYSKLNGFYDKDRNVLFHTYQYDSWSNANSISRIYFNYDELENELIVSFSSGSTNYAHLKLIKENDNWIKVGLGIFD